MHKSNLLPEKLKPGDVIGIVSPSEPVYAEQEVHYAAGAAWLERQGFAVREGNYVRVAPSGEVPTAAQKAEDLNRMFADPEVKAIICSQGGDSAQECLPYIDWNCIRQHPKIFTGISDITVLLNAIYQETGLVTFHGNDVVWGFGRKPQEYDRSEFIDRFVEGAIGDITWLLSDHLGSTSVTVDATGNLLTSLKYTAFGEIRSGDSLTDYQYTDQRNETEIGLYYYVARYYDPELGRFISADTIIPGAGSSQAYDRYAYVNNNPINFNDPSWHKYCDVAEGDCGRITGTQIAIERHITKIYDKTDVLVYGINWNLEQVVVISKAIDKMIKGVDDITGGNGQDWVIKNLGGSSIALGQGILKNNSFVFSSTIHLPNGFENRTWNAIDFSTENMIVHEFGHVFDNSFAGKEATWFGGGPGDYLLDFKGGKSTALFRWGDGLSIPDPRDRFEIKDGFGYGNTSAADYFAHSFSAAIVAPNNPYAPLKARLWVAALIDLTQ